MWNLLLQIAGSTAGLWLASRFVAGVQIVGDWQVLFLMGAILGLANAILKPILNALTLPLRILTLGLFSLIINMALVWLVDVAFLELVITGLIPLFWTTALVWLCSFALTKWMPDR